MRSTLGILQNISEAMKALFNEGEIFNCCVRIDNLLSAFEQSEEYEEIENKIRQELMYGDERLKEEPYVALNDYVYEIEWLLRREEFSSRRKEGLSIHKRLFRGLEMGDESGYESR